MLDRLRFRQNRVDVLIYCHDGRGLGHLSRSIAIALAIRRLRPETRVVLLTGSEYVPALGGYGRLDWIKLPSYTTSLSDSFSAADNNSADGSLHETVTIRRRMIRSIVADLKPRMVLVDHYPAGKQNELLPVLEDDCSRASLWFLGLRAVVGRNQAIWSKEAQTLVKDKYSCLFWYGDSSVASGTVHHRLEKHFNITFVETGYVSRAEELAAINALPEVEALEGLAAFSWCSPRTIRVLTSFAAVVSKVDSSIGSWRVTIGAGSHGPIRDAIIQRLATEAGCDVLLPDLTFLSYMKRARVALFHAGYNSLTDLIWAGIPSVVVVRSTTDTEQLLHSRMLAPRLGNIALFLSEQEASDQFLLGDAINVQASRPRSRNRLIDLRGAERAALTMLSYI